MKSASRNRHDVGMVTDDLSTSPGFNEPIAPVEAAADLLRDNPSRWQATLRPSWSARPITVPLPLRLWGCRCLILNGFVDADRMNAELKRRQAVRVNDRFVPDERSSKAWVQLYGSDYVGMSLGPLKAVFPLVCVGLEPKPAFMWWVYWGNSLLNQEFKAKVWGIDPNHLGVIETAYLGKRKAVRLLEGGRTALRMVWNSARFPDVVEVPQRLSFKTVAPARRDDGENDVELEAISLKRGDVDNTFFPFDGRDDEFEVDPTSELGKALKQVEFTPVAWQCMLNYGGVVKIYDEHGGGTPPTGARTAAARQARTSARRR